MATDTERLKALIDFAKETARLRTTPPFTVTQHKQFKRYEDQVQGLPGLHLNSGEVDFDEVWLRLERLHETKPPAPESKLLAIWLELQPKPEKEPVLKKQASRQALREIGALDPPPKNEEEPPSDSVSLEDFADKTSVEKLYKAYLGTVWKAWAAEEKQQRKSIALYSELFMLAQQMQGNLVDSQLEFVWGVGMAVWTTGNGTVTYPLLTQPVEITLNETDMSLEIRPRSSEPRLEVDIYAVQNNPGVGKLTEAAKEFFKATGNVLNPFEASTYEGLLRSAVTFLDSHGVYRPTEVGADDRSMPSATDNLVVTDTWALFARPRTNNLFVQDLERLESQLGEGESALPNAVKAIVTEPSTVAEEVSLPAFRGLSLVGGSEGHGTSKVQELYFPMPYNDEQVHIVQLLEAHEGVVVQGPPGTGKTHTIANVICHYLAQGKRVLVTSMKDPALAVLQEKIPGDIRPLAISLLTSEAEGMKQFENAINKISAEIQRIDRTAYKRDIAQIDGQIDSLHASLAKVDRQIAGWAERNLQSIDLDGEQLKPAEAANEVVLHQEDIEWFPDALSIGTDCKPQFANADVVELRAARLKLGPDIAYFGKTVPQLSSFPDSQKLLQVHQDLSRHAELKGKETAGEVPQLADASPETIKRAMSTLSRVNNLRLLRQELENAQQGWIPGLESYLRRHTRNEILDLFFALKGEIEGALAQRRGFLARPVSLPTDFDQNTEMVDAVSNLAQGRRPFGLAGLIGKGEQKQLLDAVRVVGERPQSPADWSHVLTYLNLQKRIRGLLNRWNVLAGEVSLPRVEEMPERISIVELALGLYEKVRKALQEEGEVSRELKTLLPGWTQAEQLGTNKASLGEAESILSHHLTRYRLAETWVVKESFLNALAGTEGDISERLRAFLNTRLGNKQVSEPEVQAEWSSLMDELRQVLSLGPELDTVTRVTTAMESSGAVNLAKRLREEPHSGTNDSLLLDNWHDVWRWRRLATHLESIDGRQELKRLTKQRMELEGDLAKLYRDAVTKRTWLKLSENATHGVRAALEAYRTAIRRIGRGTGVRAGRYRQDARLAAEKANMAVPCWIMPHYRICESLPPSLGCFDLVIIDEASQSDLTALPALLRAQKVLVVGDDKQVSPEGVGLEEEKVRNLMSRFLTEQVDIYRPQMTPEKSIYDLFKVVFAKSSVMLREHFRCVAPIIEYSKREYYNHELRPLRLPKASERIDPPLVDVYVEDGYREGDLNRPEARFIVDEIKRIVGNPALDRRSIGVVSLIGNEQALRIMQLLNEELGEEVVTRHHITCGDARTFQGKERDIMFLSMIASPGQVHAQTQEMFAQRFNVAASRARDRMYLVRSVTMDDLSPADTLRSRLIQHFQAPFAQDTVEIDDLRKLCESPFEREVFDELTGRGYRVIPQVPVGAYRIDMVVEGDNDSRLAIECDGDRYHGPDQWDTDMRRQRILERAGWKFWRCFASTFVLQRDAVVEDLMESLGSLDIQPASLDRPLVSVHAEHKIVRGFSIPSDVEATASELESGPGQAELTLAT